MMISAFGVDHGYEVSPSQTGVSKGELAGTYLGPLYSAGVAKPGKKKKAYATHWTRSAGGAAGGAALGGLAGAGIAGATHGAVKPKHAAIGGAYAGAIGGSILGSNAGYRANKRKGYIQEGAG